MTWIAAVVLMGCGLGAGTSESTKSSGNNLTGGTTGDDGGVAKAGGGGGPECPQPSEPAFACDAEAVTFKTCVTAGLPCAAEQAAFDACLALAPPPPADPCEAEAVAEKVCLETGTKQSCNFQINAFNACLKLHAPPPGCEPKPPPKPDCGGGEPAPEDPCQILLAAYKTCSLQPGADCSQLLSDYDACEGQGSTSPSGPSKP
jgi:hypothetical protein